MAQRKCHTAQKLKFSIKDFLSKCDQIHSFLRIWSYLVKKILMENFIFCAVSVPLIPLETVMTWYVLFFSNVKSDALTLSAYIRTLRMY